jgi:hypothetical protein
MPSSSESKRRYFRNTGLNSLALRAWSPTGGKAKGKSAKITLAQVKKIAGPEMERLPAEVAEAINAAPAGAVIAASEEPVRDAMERFRQRVYELGLRLRADAAKAAFPPSGGCDGPPPPVQGG